MTVLLYVDEEPEQGNRVIRMAALSGHFAEDEVETILPESTLDAMVDVVAQSRCQVLITDYRLAEHQAGVQYNGLDLIHQVAQRFGDFPCFLTTNFVGQALGQMHDVNLIFPKMDYLGTAERVESELPFFRRVRAKVDEFHAQRAILEQEFEELRLAAQSGTLDAEKLQRLLDLDDQLEKALGGRNAIPRIVKEKALGPFNALIGRANSLIGLIEAEMNSSGKD